MMQTAPAAAAVVKALRATEKRMVKSLAKNKKTNYSSTKWANGGQTVKSVSCQVVYRLLHVSCVVSLVKTV